MGDCYLRKIVLEDAIAHDRTYIRDLPVVRSLHERGGLELHAPVTFLVGENGTGKSTLLEAVAVAWGFNPEGGSRNFTFSTRETHAGLHRYIRLVRGAYRAKGGFFLRAESFYNVASEIDRIPDLCEDAYGGRSLHEQSHGESFLALLQNRFHGHGFYVLDEPEAALSPSRQMAMLCVLRDLVQQGAQFLIATHSPILTAFPGAQIYELDENGMHECAYRDTQNYQLTRRFVENPERMLTYLFAEPPENMD